MKKFSFSLDTVLNYKEQVLDGIKAEHMKVLVKVRKCEDEIDELEKKYNDTAQEFDFKKTKGMDIHEVHFYDNFLQLLQRQIARKLEEYDMLKKKEEEKRAKVVEAKKDCSSIQKLKEKQYEEYRKQEQKENEQMIEEFVSTKSAFSKFQE